MSVTLPFDTATDSPFLDLCLKGHEITTLSEPVLKLIQFKAKCCLNRIKDEREWHDYCQKNNIKPRPAPPPPPALTKPLPKILENEKNTKVKNAKIKSADILKRDINLATHKSVAIQTAQSKNKKVQVKLKRHGEAKCSHQLKETGVKIETVAPEDINIKSDSAIKPEEQNDKLKHSPTMAKLENEVLEELLNDLIREIEDISLKEKLYETKLKKKKHKALRKKIKELQEKSVSSSNSTFSLAEEKSIPIISKPFLLPMPDGKFKKIVSIKTIPNHVLALKFPDISNSFFDKLADDLLFEILENVTQEVLDTVDYIAAISYQEEVELL